MNNAKGNLAIKITVLFEIISILTAMMNIAAGQWRLVFLSLLAIITLTFPYIAAYIAEKNRIMLPRNFNLAATLFIFSAQYLGEIMGFYEKFWWWDLLLHGIFGIFGFITAIYLLQSVFIRNSKTTKRLFTFFNAVFAFSFTIILGTLWEMFEFAGDYFFKTHMIDEGLNDTVSDLLIKIVAAFITSIIYVYNAHKFTPEYNQQSKLYHS